MGGQTCWVRNFGEELGVARTQELLAARRLDGGRQFFSRAIDFGYSKDYRETLNIWDKQQVLSDVVRRHSRIPAGRAHRAFFPQPGGTHGHHTASTVLALEAFKLAGDTNAFPDQLRELAPWQPKRILWNAGDFSATEVLPTCFEWMSAVTIRFPETHAEQFLSASHAHSSPNSGPSTFCPHRHASARGRRCDNSVRAPDRQSTGCFVVGMRRDVEHAAHFAETLQLLQKWLKPVVVRRFHRQRHPPANRCRRWQGTEASARTGPAF